MLLYYTYLTGTKKYEMGNSRDLIKIINAAKHPTSQ